MQIRFVKLNFTFISFCLLLSSIMVFAGTTGKIAGKITDKKTGEPLIGVNIYLVETALGAASDEDGHFNILSIKPGIYTVKIRMIGYQLVTISEVRVITDQTKRINVELQMETIGLEAIEIVADRELIKPDVSASRTTISAEEIQALPIVSIESAVQLQAGVEDGLVIRGGEANEALFLLDGFAMRDPRNNQPITNIALSGIDEISLERGGFNAEYGQVRSGILNIVTKDGKTNSWNGTISFRSSPPGAKHFGISPFDRNSVWLKPYLDADVAFVGTKNGVWDQYEQRQYPVFDGWNDISRQLLEDDDPSNDLSPTAAQQEFKWRHRKKDITDQWDYDIDLGFGGPVPFVSKMLGDLRFYLTYKRNREMLLIPLTRDDYVDNNLTLKLTSNLNKNIKLSFSGIMGNSYNVAVNGPQQASLNGTNGLNNSTHYIRTPSQIVNQLRMNSSRKSFIFSDAYWSLADVDHLGLSTKLTHVLSPKTFYDLNLEFFQRGYNTRPTYSRDDTDLYELFPGYFVNQGPFGYGQNLGAGIGDGVGFSNSTARDKTKTSSLALKMDLTSQVNFNNQIKTGFEFIYNNLDLNFGSHNPNFPYTNVYIDELYNPIRAAFYIQDKIEFQGWIANIGLRLDYSNSQTEWPDVDPFSKSYFAAGFTDEVEYKKKSSDAKLTVSPRLGISHPITETSKLFFNYGHFKQLPSYEHLLQLSRGSLQQVKRFGDPNLALAKTISYELGYDHVLFDDYLIQLAGFYHDIKDQIASTTYISADASVSYSAANSNSYEDIRGFELTLKKIGGMWWRGFATYSYQVKSSGRFGTDIDYQNPSDQRDFESTTGNFVQSKPIPQPWANTVLTFFSPNDFGPDALGFKPLGDWNMSVIGDWRAGWMATRNTNKVSGVSQNVKTKDWYNLDFRLTKQFNFDGYGISFIMDVNNALNVKRLSLAGFMDAHDSDNYWDSLHLPKSNAYNNIVGDDRYGDYRKKGVTFQPIEQVGDLNGLLNPNTRAFYYETSSGNYMQYDGSSWSKVSKSKLNKVLEDKAYIDMPNETSFNFLNPRQIYYGIKITFKL